MGKKLRQSRSLLMKDAEARKVQAKLRGVVAAAEDDVVIIPRDSKLAPGDVGVLRLEPDGKCLYHGALYIEEDLAKTRLVQSAVRNLKDIQDYLETAAAYIDQIPEIDNVHCMDATGEVIGKSQLARLVRDGRAQGCNVVLHGVGISKDVHVQTAMLDVKGKNFLVDAGRVESKNTVFMLHKRGSTADTNHYDMLQRRTPQGWSVVFDKKDEVSIGKAVKVIERERRLRVGSSSLTVGRPVELQCPAQRVDKLLSTFPDSRAL